MFKSPERKNSLDGTNLQQLLLKLINKNGVKFSENENYEIKAGSSQNQ